jgi:hypothetical protein
MFYMSKAGPYHMFRAAMQFTHPFKMIREVKEMDPSMEFRTLEFEDLDWRQRVHPDFKGKIDKWAMGFIRIADRMAVTVGWKAVYDASRARDMSHEQAVIEAREFTNRTQPTGDAGLKSSIYRKSEFWRMLLTFTQQINKIFNMMVFDLSDMAKNKKKIQYASTILSIGMSAAMLWCVGNRRFPEDGEDLKDMFGSYALNMIPVIGKTLNAYAHGYYSQPALGAKWIAQFAQGTALAVKGLEEPLTDKQRLRMRDLFIEGGSLVTGVYYTGLNRIAKSILEKDPFYVLLGGPLQDEEPPKPMPGGYRRRF